LFTRAAKFRTRALLRPLSPCSVNGTVVRIALLFAGIFSLTVFAFVLWFRVGTFPRACLHAYTAFFRARSEWIPTSPLAMNRTIVGIAFL